MAFLLLCVGVYVIACDVLRAGPMRSLRDRLRREMNRNRFGELRTDLVRKAIDGEIDPRSELFLPLYRGLTALMRNPQELEAVARITLMLPAPGRRTARRPTRSEGLIAREFARRIDLLCRDYFRSYSWMAWVADRLDKHELPLWIRVPSLRAREERARTLVAARERLEQTANEAA